MILRLTWLSLCLVFVVGCSDDEFLGNDGALKVGDASTVNTDGECILASSAMLENGADTSKATNGIGGTFDVVSLGYADDNNSIVFSWNDKCVANGPGDDVVVFENAFRVEGSDDYFMDLLVVEVSLDGESWTSFPHDYLAEDERKYSRKPKDWSGFAGKMPVNTERGDLCSAGGDAFDLDQIEDATIREQGFCFLRLVSAPSRINPDTGESFVRDPLSNGADIDAVAARYFF